MSVGEHLFPNMPALAGMRLGTAAAAIKYRDRKDILLIELNADATTAAVFTKNAFAAAPVLVGREHLATSQGKIRYLLINSGNANACTGDRGRADAIASCQHIAAAHDISPNQVLPFSTGVVGELLNMEKIRAGTDAAIRDLGTSDWLAAEKAIMTTDTRPKGVTKTIEINGTAVTINGIAKGSGMIKPNMATMLAYVATDAAIDAETLQPLLNAANQRSFNRIVIDGDTSTNDALVLMATGKSATIGPEGSDSYSLFATALTELCESLACEVVRDGEGATKFVTVEVNGGVNADECLKVAYAVAQSPLIKTALFASDPNWGRIVVAIGYAGVDGLNPERVNVFLDQVRIVHNGGRDAQYEEAMGQEVMNQDAFTIRIELNRGECSETVWTTDFSHDYVTINAEYRT